jgi:hypothetical protein
MPILYPFGRPDVSVALADRVPKKLGSIRFPSDTWAFTDCDYQLMTNLGIASATYMDYVAREPVHSAKSPAVRNALFFDMGVRGRKTPK